MQDAMTRCAASVYTHFRFLRFFSSDPNDRGCVIQMRDTPPAHQQPKWECEDDMASGVDLINGVSIRCAIDSLQKDPAVCVRVGQMAKVGTGDLCLLDRLGIQPISAQLPTGWVYKIDTVFLFRPARTKPVR